MRYLWVPGIALAVALTAAGAARSEQLRICYEEWAPFSQIKDGQATGVVIDVMDRALAIAGHTASYSQQPYLRCISNVRAGIYDAMLLTSDESGFAPTSVSVAFWEVGVVARPDWPDDDYRSLADFNGALVGLVSAYVYHPAVQRAAPRWKTEYAIEAILNLRKASAGRIDLTVVDIPWARIQAAREGLGLKMLTPILFATPQYSYFTPGRAALLPGINAALQRLLDDGTVDRLYQAATGSSFSEARTRAESALIR